MTKIKLTGIIVGGPRDGHGFSFETDAESDVLDKMDKMRLEDHVYKIVEFDRDKMHVTLMY